MENCLAYNGQNQIRASSQAPGGYGYDAAGDIAYDGSNNYVYDDEGRLCAVRTSLTGAWTGYLYDAAGNRVAKGSLSSYLIPSNACNPDLNGFVQTAGYVTGPSGEQLTEVDGNFNWVHTNVYAGGKLIATYDAPTPGTQLLHFHVDDPLGTRRVQFDANGTIEATYQSLPFGDGYNAIPAPGSPTAEDPTENHFTNKERDSESGNDYFEARYYSSNTARFLSPDPLPWIGWQGVSKDYQEKFEMWIANPQNLNEYAYVNNNPMNHTDPTGMNACGTNDDKTCKVTITITAREKGDDGKYLDGKNSKIQSQYNATATVTVNGKVVGTFLAKSTPDDSKKSGTAADGTYDAAAGTHRGTYADIHINSSKEIPTAFPNPNLNAPSEWTANGVEIHKSGMSDGTMGSAERPISEGCQTIQSSHFAEFQHVTGLVPGPNMGAQQQHFTVVINANGGDE